MVLTNLNRVDSRDKSSIEPIPGRKEGNIPTIVVLKSLIERVDN